MPAYYFPYEPQPNLGERRLVNPVEGEPFTFVSRHGTVRHYTVVSSERAVSFAAVVRLENINSGGTAWVSKHWLSNLGVQPGHWERGHQGTARDLKAAA